MVTTGRGEATVNSFGLKIGGKLGGLARRIVYGVRQPTKSGMFRSGVGAVERSKANAKAMQ